MTATTDATSLATFEPPLTGLQSIATRKTAMIVNSFIINTVDFLNKFASIAENKLQRVEQSIQRVEIVLNLLEGKLESVPWLNDPSLLTAAPATSGTSAAPSAPSMDGAGVPAAPPVEDLPPPPPAVQQILLKDDTRYQKYFKMLAMGVPKQALRVKMAADGVDSDIIDMDPEGPAPEGASVPSPKESEEDYSNSDGSDSGSDSD